MSNENEVTVALDLRSENQMLRGTFPTSKVKDLCRFFAECEMLAQQTQTAEGEPKPRKGQAK
jgi:hypothetical protein